jgi:hypothetical protein
MPIHLESESYLKKPQDLGANQGQSQDQQQQRIQLPHRQGHVTLPQGHVHLDPSESSGATTTTTNSAATATTSIVGAGQRLLTARERDALIEDLKLEVETRVRKLRSHHELAARALRTKIEMRINRVPRRYWDMTLRELQQLPRAQGGAAAGAGSAAGTNSPRKPAAGDGIRVTKAASTGSKPSTSSSGSGNAGGKSAVSTAATAAAAIRRTGRAAAAGARHGTALSSEASASRRGLTRSLRSRGT